VLIVFGIVLTFVIDEFAKKRERDRQARARAELLKLLEPNPVLAGQGCVHRPGLSAPDDLDLTVTAGLDQIDQRSRSCEMSKRS
jgi:hypothetical protein